MRIANAAFILSLIAQSTKGYYIPNGRTLHRHGQSASAAFSSSLTRTASSLAAAASSSTEEEIADASSSFVWRAREDCWRPDVSDVERISWGKPAKKKRTGSRGVPHRLNEDERRAFDQARKQGFLQVTGSSWRAQRSDAPLLNSYRSLMDARGRPSIVLHKLSPNSNGGIEGDRLDVDLSPLRLPDEFELIEKELKDRILADFDVESQTIDSTEEDADEMDEMEIIENSNTDDSGDNYELRPIYQLSPYYLSWEVSRQEGKKIGKYLGGLFDNIEAKATKSKKPKGVKPGKGRRHGGYGIG